MKKLLTLLCAIGLASSLFAQKTTETTVTNKADLTAAIEAAAELSPGDIARIYIQGEINLGNHTFAATTRTIEFIGINDNEGNKAVLKAEFIFPTNESEADKFGIIFDNLRLEDYNGAFGNSKHFINFKDNKQHFVDIFAVRNCEITNICRSFLRGQIDGAGEGYKGCGTFNKFEMTNCVVHNAARQANAMPLIYMAWSTNEMAFRNNTFYDLTYLNSIVTFAYMTDDTGRQPVKFYFENNTVCAWSKSSLFSFGQYVTGESEFHIKNNILLFPTWADDSNNRFGDTNTSHGNMGTVNEKVIGVDGDGNPTEEDPTNGILTEEEIQARIEKGTVLTNITEGGLVQLENNMIFGYKYQDMSDNDMIIPIGDTEDEEVEFSSLAMEDVPFSWSDFADPLNDFFQINISNPAYTAGKNGAPLGDVTNYTDKVIKVVTLNVSVSGSKSAKVTITPEKSAYTSGDVVTITADCNGSLNTFKGWSNGKNELTIEETLTDDLNLIANFEEIEYFAVWNLDDITSNNVVKTPPVAVNYGGGATLDYARYIVENEAYRFGAENSAEDYDGAKKAIQTRNNKLSEGEKRNCFLIQTPNTQFLAGEEGKADYLIINVIEDLAASKLQFYVASDNIPYNQYAVSYSADGETWTQAGTFDMEGKAQTNEWYLVEINLPNLAAGSKIRIKGVEGSGMALSEQMKEDIEGGLEVGTEFLFVAELILMPGSGVVPAKGDVNDDGAVNVADISAIIDVMAGTADYKYADVNEDGSVNVADISNVIDIMAGGE